MAHLTEPWRRIDNDFSVPLDSISPLYPTLNKANVFDNDSTFFNISKSRNNYLFPWKLVTLESLILNGKAFIEGPFSFNVNNGKLLLGVSLKFKKDDRYLPIGDVVVLVPSDSRDTIQSLNIQQNLIIPLFFNDENYSRRLELKRGTSLFPPVTTSSGCPNNFGHILVPNKESIPSDFIGIGAVFMFPITEDNKNDIRYYAAVKKSWLEVRDKSAKSKLPWALGKAQCGANQNTPLWFNTPFNTFRAISSTTMNTNELSDAYRLKIDTSKPVEKIENIENIENENNTPTRAPSSKPKNYTWVWILIGIILVISLFVFLYFVLKN